jgi:VanZ family protein
VYIVAVNRKLHRDAIVNLFHRRMLAHTPFYDRRLALVTAMIVGLIVYGSLFPFDFQIPAASTGALGALIQTWDLVPSRGNLIANTLLYAPLGFFGFLALRTNVDARIRVLASILSGVVLSVVLELTQFYDAGRRTHLADVYANTIGTVLGALGGIVFGTDGRWPPLREIAAKPFPALLLIAWLGYRLFPFVPTIDLHKYWDALKPVFLTPSLSTFDLLRYTAMWLTICAMIEAIAGQNRSRLLFPIVAGFVFVAKILILTKVLSVAEIAGAGVAFAIWLLLLRCDPRTRSIIAVLILATVVVALRLAPFDFQATARQFGWIPFLSFMSGSLMLNVQSFLEKFFYYGSLLWLLTEAGLPVRYAALVVALGLFSTSLAEIYLPGRSAEITDAAMALLIAWIFSLMTERSSPGGRASTRV